MKPVTEKGVLQLKLTISYIAKLAGVSKATVSRVLNGTGYVSEETRRKILEIVKKYDYTPDSKAVSLSKKRTYTVGLVLPSTSGPFYGEVLRGVEEVLSQNRYFTLLMVLDSGKHISKTRERYVAALKEKRVDGAIIFDPTLNPEQLKKLKIHSLNLPIVFLLRDFHDLGFDSIMVDNRSASADLTRHLVKVHGYKKFAFVKGPKESEDSEERFRGFMGVLKESGLNVDDVLVFSSDFTYEGGRRIFQEIRPHLRSLEAIYCANDEMALGVIEELKGLNVRPGKDIAVVGFDDAFWAQHIDPPLTTVHQPMYECGKIAADRVLNRIENPDTFKNPVKILLKAELVVRKSCGC